MGITAFDHYTVRSSDLDKSARFYAEILGLRVQKLDSFQFPFAMLFLGDQPVVQLLGAGPALDEFLGRSAPSHGSGADRMTGNLEHVAFNGADRADFVARLERAAVPYRTRTLTDYNVAQLFFEDPDGVEIEVNFPIEDRA